MDWANFTRLNMPSRNSNVKRVIQPHFTVLSSVRMEPASLTEAVGSQLRGLRNSAGVTAEEVAEAARDMGLQWQRSTVASIESGRRAISAEELLLLPVILTGALGRVVRLRDLVGAHVIRLGAATVTPAALQAVLQSKRAGSEPEAGWQFPGRTERLAALTVDRELLDQVPGAEDMDRVHLVRGVLWSVEETTQALSRRLGCTAFQAAVACSLAWGADFRAERDERVAQRRPKLSRATPAALRAMRGHVAREMSEELRDIVSTFPKVD